jgi:hypothetical protein
MRFVSLSLVAAAVALASLPAQSQDLPKRKAGLWEIKATSASGMPPTVMQQCTDEAFEAQMQKTALEQSKTMCSKNEIKRSGNTITSDAVCKMGPTTVTSQSVTSGDFSSAYKVEVKSTFNPPLMGKASDSTVMEARYLGACAAGQKPGAMSMPNMPIPPAAKTK